MPNCQSVNCPARPSSLPPSRRYSRKRAPLPLTLVIAFLETILARVICFFDAIERLIPPYVILVTIVSIAWSIDQYGILSGIMFGIPLGLVMALVHAIFLISAMFLLGVALWLTLIPFYLLATSCHWQLPTVLEKNPTVERWMQRWATSATQYSSTTKQSTTQQFSGLMIGVLLGGWLLD